MMRCKEMLSILALTTIATTAGLVAPPAAADVATTPLCNSVRGACEISPPDVPVLRADVCWNGSVATLKSGDCADGSRPYFVEYGEVDPITAAVLAYAPVPDTCDMGFCSVNGPLDGTEIAGFLCCSDDGKPCSEPPNTMVCAMGDLTYCKNYTLSTEGAVCHDDK